MFSSRASASRRVSFSPLRRMCDAKTKSFPLAPSQAREDGRLLGSSREELGMGVEKEEEFV